MFLKLIFLILEPLLAFTSQKTMVFSILDLTNLSINFQSIKTKHPNPASYLKPISLILLSVQSPG